MHRPCSHKAHRVLTHIALVIVVLTLCCHATVNDDVPDFVPSVDWRIVLPGQAVPAGLEIRMNLSTGRKEARLMPEEPGDAKQIVFRANHPSVRKHDIKTAARNGDPLALHLVQLIDNVPMGSIRLVRALRGIQTEAHESATAHQLDNWGGHALLVLYLHHPVPEVRTNAAWAIASAAQNNPDGQRDFLNAGALEQLTKNLRSSSISDTPVGPREVSKCFHAIGAIIRDNQAGIQKFKELKGASILAVHTVMLPTSLQEADVTRRVLALATDLASENHMDALALSGESYFWCDHAVSFLKCQSLDLVEKALRMLDSTSSYCAKHLLSSKPSVNGLTLPVLINNMRQRWEAVKDSEAHAYEGELSQLAQSVLRRMRSVLEGKDTAVKGGDL